MGKEVFGWWKLHVASQGSLVSHDSPPIPLTKESFSLNAE